MNAVGYCRISTKDQSRYSLEYQASSIKQYCSRHSLALLDIFTDDGESSYSFDRPDWKALEAYIKKNKNVQYLVIFDHDRFSRNLAEALMKIKELNEKFKIKVLATTDAFDTDFADPSTFMIRAFKFMMAENELHRIRQRTKAGLKQAAMQGRHINRAPYGFTNARDINGKPVLTIDEKKAEIIRTIFKEYLAGTNIEKIRSIVKAMGYKQQGSSALQRVLANPVYAGYVKIPGTRQTAEGLHPNIISKQDYWLTQERLNGKHIKLQDREEVPLRGVLKCFCGRLVTAGNSKSKSGRYYWYYLCKDHRNNLSAVTLHKQFNEILENLSFEADTIEWFRKKLSDKLAAYINEKSENLASVKRELQTIKNKIETIDEKYLLQPDLSPATYKKVVTELRADEARLQMKLAEINTSNELLFERLNTILPALANLKKAYELMPLHKKHQFINLVFDQSLYHDGTIYRTPFIHELFAGKALILKEKGLLIKDNPVLKLGETPIRSEIGS